MDTSRFAAEHDAIAAVVRARVCERPGVDAARVDAYLAELRGDFSLPFHAALRAVAEPALGFALNPPGSGFDARARLSATGPLDAIRDLAERATLILAPTHSSSFDTIVLALTCARERLPHGVYPADTHMFRNRVIAAALRHLGSYRIFRARTDRLYWDVVLGYATALLERGFHAVVFPGGTRNRSNAVESELKGGFLRTGLRAQHGGHAVKPMYVVPIAINHQVVFEAEWLVAYQLSGRAAERVVGDELWVWGRLRDSLRRLQQLDQKIVLNFGEPIPLARYGAFEVARLSADVAAAYRTLTTPMVTHLAAAEVYAQLAQAAGTDDVHRLIGRTDVFPATEAMREAARIFAACHRSPPFRIVDGGVQVADVGLLWFYRNRVTSSGRTPAAPAAPP